MGLSSSKSKTTQQTDPYAAAKPAIDAGLQQIQGINATNQPRLESISGTLADAFQSIAPSALGANSFVSAAQGTAQDIANGKYVGTNPGGAIYNSLMQGGANPAAATLAQLAAGSKSPGQYDGIGTDNPALAALSGLTSGGTNSAVPGLTQLGYGGAGISADAVHTSQAPNLGDMFAAQTAAGGYLNGQPSASFYADTLGGKYLNANPYLDAMVQQSTDSATKAANARFAAAGMGEGLSTPYAQALGSSVASAENALRYGAYNDELSRMGQIAGQSDAAYASERQQMGQANSLLSANANARADRALDASKTNAANKLAADTSNATIGLDALGKLSDANNQTFNNALGASTALGSLYNSTGALNLSAQQAKDAAFANDRAAQLAAAQAQSGAYNADQQLRLSSAQAADNAYSAQTAQVLQALGIAPELANAQYAGLLPALDLAKAAATIPYAGSGQYADILNALAGKYGTQTTTKTETPSAFDQIMNGVSLASTLATGFPAAGGFGSAMSAAGLQSGILNATPIGMGGFDLSRLYQ